MVNGAWFTGPVEIGIQLEECDILSIHGTAYGEYPK
jgi:hypothetical protein